MKGLILHSGNTFQTALNPADDASRGLRVAALVKCERWFAGPPFLCKSEDQWPTSPLIPDVLPEEFVLKERKVVAVHLVSTKLDCINQLINRYSSWKRMKKAVAWLLRFVKFIRTKNKLQVTDPISVAELQKAELAVIKYVQQQEFAEEIRAHSQRDHKYAVNKRVSRKSGRSLQRLNPILVDGVLRVGGRLHRAPVAYDLKHPVILPNKHHVTNLIIEDHHNTVQHSGMGLTWTLLRQKYWVVRGGVAVRRVLGQCIFCCRRNAPIGQQMMANLPRERITPGERPFTYVGVDYFGPLLVKQGRSEVKRYGCIFTCLTVRAVHIEIAHSLSTDSFIDALRRLIGRRGKPKKIFSDNGTNFIGANRVLRDSLKAWNQAQIYDCLRQRDIEWAFNPPTASHMGGVWERLIRSVRKILSALMSEQTPNDETLITFMVEVEAKLNSRPLTPVTMDTESDEPLTPNHLVLLGHCDTLPPGVFDKKDNYVRRRWRQVQYLANQFWSRWVNEYLPTLQVRQTWTVPERNLAHDDLVLLADNSVSRGRWLTGRVVDTYPAEDGSVRTLLVKTKNGTLKRPIAKLCLIRKAGEN
uniref:Uncharacterized protein LOC104265735 n=1 Tax=Phallusia mammillata TaxID=59560 RepID=A0A6F9DJR4_9ASCI|nr:uncharacterized protein LOC104265735 [Phallusia mammillata]